MSVSEFFADGELNFVGNVAVFSTKFGLNSLNVDVYSREDYS